MNDLDKQRLRMVERQITARGVRNPAVLDAMRTVPREAFVSDNLAEFAYEDTPLPIPEGQTISQPYIVALMIESANPRPTDRALEIGTGSGYAAAVLSQLVAEVYTIERHEQLAQLAKRRFAELGYSNTNVLHGDGTLGWPEHAPYDLILVTAGGPQVPQPLLEQLAVGGRLIIPVGSEPRLQNLVRVTRVSEDRFDEEDLGDVQFVPLIGAEGWNAEVVARSRASTQASRPETVAKLIREAAEPIADIDEVDLGPLLDRIGDARVVLLGEATHGTSEFYRMRARITRELVLRRGFNSSQSKPTGPMPRGSMIMCATLRHAKTSGRLSLVSRLGCGAIMKPWKWLSGCAPITPKSTTPSATSDFMGSIFTVFLHQSVRSPPTSTAWIRRWLPSRGGGMRA